MVHPAHECAVDATVARYYDPTTAQILTRDPLEAETGEPYSYAGDDPVDNSDPSGLHWYDDASNWVAGFGDTLTLGGTAQIRRLINYDVNGDMSDVVDTCSTFYTWGGYGGLDAGLGLGAEDAADGLGSIWERLRSLDFSDDTGAVGRYANLGSLSDRADETVADVIRSRGGGASQIRQLQSGYGQLTLGEISELAANGDREASRALKMVKQAGTQGKGGK